MQQSHHPSKPTGNDKNEFPWLTAIAVVVGIGITVNILLNDSQETKQDDRKISAYSDDWETTESSVPVLPIIELEMVRIPSGTFRMGSLESEKGRDNDESPQHEVTIAYDF